MRRAARLLGTLLIVAGIGTLGWVVAVWQWQDPFTALYTKWEQHRLEARLDRQLATFEAPPAAPTTAAAPASPGSRTAAPLRETARVRVDFAAERAHVAAEARRYARELHRGDPVGRLEVPRLGLKIVVVNGTDHDSLTKGPGRYLGSGMPGEGRLVYVAGHRTTYLAPFSHIDSLRPGDPIALELPYATFHYAVTRRRIVPANDLAVLRSRGREELVLQACHPRFFASHRYLAYARLVSVVPRSGAAFTIAGRRVVAATVPAQASLR